MIIKDEILIDHLRFLILQFHFKIKDKNVSLLIIYFTSLTFH